MGDERGSSRMFEERFGKPAVIPEEDLLRLLELVQNEGIKVIDWHNVGTPDPFEVTGSFQVQPEFARDVIVKLLDSSSRLNFTVFPIGIPFPELLGIEFGVRGQGR